MKNAFYFNLELNTCATENWVVDYLFYNMGVEYSRKQIREALHSKREFFGWYECEVSDDICEVMPD